MKSQASLSLKIVDTPINVAAEPDAVTIRATSNGLVVNDGSGTERPLVSGQEYTINNNAADNNGNFEITAEGLGAANAQHTHEIVDVTDLQSTLDGKSPTSHTHQLVQSLVVGDQSISNAVKLQAGDNVSLETVLNTININVNAQAAGAAAAVQNLATADGGTVKVFIGTESQWTAFTKETGVKYLVYILEG
jgi:hypothetical protein